MISCKHNTPFGTSYTCFMCKQEMELYASNKLRMPLDRLIVITPTGDFRNSLTEMNMLLLRHIEVLGDSISQWNKNEEERKKEERKEDNAQN